MESKEDRLLGSVIANHLFLSQFELFRACLFTLSVRSPGLARDIYQTVIRKIWTLKGVVWSDSVPSSAHMAWLCLQELHTVEAKLMEDRSSSRRGSKNERHRGDDPWGAATASSSPAPSVPGFRDNQWQFYCRPVYDCIEFLLLLEFIKQYVVDNGKTIARDISGKSDEEDASFSETTGVGDKFNDDQSLPDERSGLLVVGKIVSAGLERLDFSIKSVTGHRSDVRERDDRSNDGLNEAKEDNSRAETTDSCPPGSDEGADQPLSEVDKKWLRHLTLGQPDLLDALCQNIARQQHGGLRLQVDDQMNLDAELGGGKTGIRVEEVLPEDSASSGQAILDSLEHFELGSCIQREVQQAHLNQIKEDIEVTQLLKAISHLRFLHEDFGIAESDCSEAIHSILKESKSLVREQHDSVLRAIYECSLTSGSALLPKLIESAQDDILREELHESKDSPQSLYPPPLERLHQRMEELRSGSSSGSGSFSMTETSAVRTCLRELYQYARVDDAHVLELVVKAALASVKDRQLQKVADLVTPFPRLQPLVAVMGWDLLPGHTKSRRKLLEFLWNSKIKLTALPHGRAADEVSCVEQLCDQLCYRLELAYFATRSVKGVEGQPASTRIFVKGNRPKVDLIEGPADPFVANLVLERLTMHSPVRVLFDVVPDIKLSEALEMVKLQPTGTSAEAYRQRHLDLELLHMHYGLQAIVLALNAMEVSTDSESDGTAVYLLQLREHLDCITSPVRRVWMMGVIVSLVHMDAITVNLPTMKDPFILEPRDEKTEKTDKFTAIAFIQSILTILHQCMPGSNLELDSRAPSASKIGVARKSSMPNFTFPGRAAKRAWLKQLDLLHQFVDDWRWRIGVLQRLSPSSQRPWQWRESLAVLRAAPSTILNMCVQRNQFDLGQEAVHRYKLSPEEVVSLQLAQWVDSAVSRASVDDAISRVAGELSSGDDNLDFTAPLAPLATVLLCVDVAATTVRPVSMARRLLDRARVLLSQIQPVGQRGQGPEQRQEACMAVVAKRTVHRLTELLDQDKVGALQLVLSGADMVSMSGTDSSRQVFRQRALAILQQTIEDAHRGKRQFLSGKLHNLVKALADEEGEDLSTVQSAERKSLLGPEHSLGLGLGFRVSSRQGSKSSPPSVASGSIDFSGDGTFQVAAKGAMKRFLGPLSNKPMAYLSAFILYIATVGDIVDGVDTTHDFNFFTLIYERPNDLLTRLVFERGSADAAGKVAEIMGADLVHQVISACVPPVYPPRGGKGWACIPQLPTRVVQSASQRRDVHVVQTTALDDDDEPKLYPLQLDVVKHLATLSPVRSILACVFGQSCFTIRANDPDSADSSAALDADRSFFDFALEQSEKYPTLNRWIQLQAKLQSLSDVSTSSHKQDAGGEGGGRTSLKRPREPEVDGIRLPIDSDERNEVPETSELASRWSMKPPAVDGVGFSPPISGDSQNGKRTSSYSLMFDWENEAPYSEAVLRLMDEGKLVEALSVSDRWLRDGAPDQLLQLLIEKGEETESDFGNQWQEYNSSHPYCSSWQYCIRLRNKTLAATLALKYLQRWDLDAAIDVLTMCSCHLSPDDSLYLEVVKKRDTLHQYGRIQRADNRFTQWQEVEALCQSDPEGLALRLAGKGAVSAALDVAESFKLSSDLRRELQGRQLVKLLTTDPISGGGPAGGLRFLNSLLRPEDALPVAMAAMELLPNLQSKQLLVHFFLKRRVGSLSDEEHARLDRLALGLRMLGALPLPWQQRCSALHEHPRLILETLLMGKQLKAASQLLQAFPSLKDDELVKVYAGKALMISSTPPLERRSSTSAITAVKPISRSVPPSARSNFNSGLNTLQRRAFSWRPRDTGNKIINQDNSSRKRKITGMLPPSHKAAWEALAGVPEDRPPSGLTTLEGYERPAPMTITEEWILTGDSVKDDGVRNSHRYESAPSSILFKALLELCSSEAVACKAAVDICIVQINRYLSSDQLPRATFNESAERGFHAAEAFVQALQHARDQLRKLTGKSEEPPTSPKAVDSDISNPLDHGDAASSSTTPGTNADGVQGSINLLEVLEQAETWLNRVELLQTLFGFYVPASLHDIIDDIAAEQLRDRLIADERYNLAVFMCTKCKIDPFLVWEAWGHALLRIEHYAQARLKFKRCLQLHSGDPAPVVRKIIHAMEAGPPADVFGARSLYAHMARSVSTSSDDSLSADSYLNVLYVPPFNKPDRSRRSSEESADSHQTCNTLINGDESPPHSHLDETRYEECIYYLQEHNRQDLMQFMFQHCRYTDACNLFFPFDSLPPAPVPSSYQSQRPDPLATDYGSLDELCDSCVAFGVVPILERVIAARIVDTNNPDSPVSQHTASSLTRICTYFENHRHFNHLYRFQVLKKDYVAAGLCCIQLFLNSSNHEQALRHLDHAKVHFDEGLLARQQSGETTKGVTKASRGKLPSQKLTEEELIKFTSRVAVQIEVVRTFGDSEGPPWRHSLFGNPNDTDTVKRRCEVAEKLVEKNFDLAFRIINEFNLTAVHIYAGVAFSLAERKKSNQLAELLRNIKGTIEDDDWDQVLGAAINVYANLHRERPTGLIDKLSSNHRKVLACVICGRLKSAFQIASRSESISDVQYVAHVARQTGSLAVEDLCKQWLASHSL